VGQGYPGSQHQDQLSQVHVGGSVDPALGSGRFKQSNRPCCGKTNREPEEEARTHLGLNKDAPLRRALTIGARKYDFRERHLQAALWPG
jgi:hypothetical protein